jgi:tetratricopeptide (TPR) repeat protein
MPAPSPEQAHTRPSATSADWARVEAHLEHLLELPAGERPAAIDRLSAGDQWLRSELRSLVEQMEGEDALLDSPAVNALTPDAPAESPVGMSAGEMIGAYRIIDLLGRGGMGEVYRAERADGQFEQTVALKIMRGEVADQAARFRVERQILAQLSHPGIARLLDGGVTADGRPYMAMELVIGEPITTWCRRRGTDLAQRLQLFMAVCDSVAYAHANLVVHRDIKPGNVLVTEDGVVKLVDFGIAKLLSAGAGNLTRHAPATPGYSAPEQLTGGTVTVATDVYALGMLLFELLCGEMPWKKDELSFAAALHTILSENIPSPSRFALQTSASPFPANVLQGDLDAIVMKALRKEPEQRYSTVNQLRDDVTRVLDHEPVTAREGARLYIIGRFIRRQRLLVTSTAVVLLAVLAGLIGVSWQAREARLQAQRAQTESQKATAVKDFLLDIFKQSSLQNPGGVEARKLTAEQLLNLGADRIGSQLKNAPEVRAELMDTLALLYNDLGVTDRATVLALDNLATSLRSSGGRPTAASAQLEVRLAQSLINAGKEAEGTKHLQHALGTLNQLGDRDSLQLAEIDFELARALYDGTASDRRTGTQNLIAALEIVQRRAPDNPLRGEILDYLARYAKLNEDFGAAEHWLKERLTFETARGLERNAFAIGDTYLVLGDFQGMIRQYGEAESNLRKAIALLSQSAGPNHPETADARARLGEMLFDIGHRTDAETLLKDALEAQLTTPLGVEDSTETRKTLGIVELARGNLPEAQRVLSQNLEQLKGRPDKALRYAVSASHFTVVLAAEGRTAEARALYDESLQTLAQHIGESSIAYARALNRGGLLALAENKPYEAATIFEHVLKDWPPAEGQLPDTYTKAVLGLATARLDQGRPEETRRQAADLLQKLSAAPQPDQYAEQEAQGRRLLGEALRRLGKMAEAETELRRAVDLRQRLDEPNSPWLAQARINLAASLLAQHQTQEARRLLTSASAAQSQQPLLHAAYRRELQETLSAGKLSQAGT